MTSPRARRPWLRAACFGAAALAMIVAACEAPGPVQPAPSSVSMQPVRTESSTGVAVMTSGVRISRSAIESAVRANYPEVFSAAATDTSTLMFVIAPGGEIERHDRIQMKRASARPIDGGEAHWRWRESTGLSDRESESSIADVVTFRPGQMGPGQVEVVWVRKLSPSELVTTRETRRERVEHPAGPPRFRTMQNAEVQITAEQARALVVRYLPEVARNGTPAESVWFVTDARGEVVAYGDGNDDTLNQYAQRVDNVQVFKGEQMVFNGQEIGVVYVRIKA